MKKLIPHPAFLRLGLTAGGIMPLSTGSELAMSTGLRAEYGFSNKFSLVGDVQLNDGRNNASVSTLQTTLAVRWMLFKVRRLQPFFAAGWGLLPHQNIVQFVTGI